MWRGNIDGPISRYKICYGPNINLYTDTCNDAYKLEHEIRNHKYHLRGKLYDKKYMNKYINYMTKKCDNL